MTLRSMPFARAALIACLVLVTATLGAAHWFVAREGSLTMVRPCPPNGVGVSISGFGSGDSPRVDRACSAGVAVPVTARMEEGELVLESTSPALLALDGQRPKRDLQVNASTIDHGYDIWWARLLESATPFASFDRTSPVSGSDGSIVPVEPGRPRVSNLPSGGSRATIDIGTHADDDSLSMVLLARPVGQTG